MVHGDGGGSGGVGVVLMGRGGGCVRDPCVSVLPYLPAPDPWQAKHVWSYYPCLAGNGLTL